MPDLTSLEEEYERPTGAFGDGAAAQALIARFPELPRLAEAFRTTRLLISRADEARDAADGRDGPGIELRGRIDVTVDCPGEGTGAAAPGSLAIELAVSKSRIRKSFWTQANHCWLEANVAGAMVPVELDGDLALDLGGDIPLGGTWPTSPMLISLVGTIAVGGLTVGGISGRVDDESFEYLQQSDSGSVVLFVTSTGIGLRDADETWYCGTDGEACAFE